MPLRKREAGQSTLLPFCREAILSFIKVSDGQRGAGASATGLVKVGEAGRWGVTSQLQVAPKHALAEIDGTQAFALEREEGGFIGGIRHAQVSREFEAVDDCQFRSQADMFGAQVTMAFHDLSRQHSLPQHIGEAVKCRA